MQSKDKNNIKNQILSSISNRDRVFGNRNTFNKNHSNNYDFVNLKNQNKNKDFEAKSQLDLDNKRELFLGKSHHATSLNEKSKILFLSFSFF